MKLESGGYSKPGSVLMDRYGPVGIAEEANAQLALISPPSAQINWLHAYWEPGEPWMPIHRLVIAEMIPRAQLAGEEAFYRLMGEEDSGSLFNELEGPNPRTLGHFDKILQRYVYDGLPPNVSERQWLLWREQRAFARPIWIVQGRMGGHKRRLSELERTILRFHGRPDYVPFPGALPFARFDARILDKLSAMDRLQKWMEDHTADWRHRTTEDVSRARDEAKAKIEADIFAWLDSQIVDIAA